ncbi:uncharacterized protein LOC117190970 [Drosophila miranda]|uniref:uncharacterized protein LOC117190970 n=1 Tax=Drosophila miranda TaxID=7229 RepID=UPI00143FA385|nr:uncharacterized protein LOC117190970 [Drosophila miranda]
MLASLKLLTSLWLLLWLRLDSVPGHAAFTNCVNQPLCAANTIQSYMYKHGQDCNGDDHIDCLDFGALHNLGNLKCRGELPYIFAKVFNSCLKYKERQAQNADQTPNQVKIKDQSST